MDATLAAKASVIEKVHSLVPEITFLAEFYKREFEYSKSSFIFCFSFSVHEILWTKSRLKHIIKKIIYAHCFDLDENLI